MQFNNTNNTEYTAVNRKETALSENQVLRKTYFLLSLTILFSAFVSFATLAGFIPYTTNPLITIVGMFGFMFLAQSLSETKWGLTGVFAFTGFMGYILAPIIAMYLHSYQNGGLLVTTALGGTGAIFLSLSAYVVMSRKDFSYMGGFLFAAITVAFISSVASLFLNIPILPVIVSAAFILISSGLILFQTSQIINGGERNHIRATISLYIALFNLFLSLLRVLSYFGGRR